MTSGRQELSRRLGCVRRRCFALSALATLGRAAAGAAIPLLLCAGLFGVLAPSGTPLMVLVAAAVVLACAVAGVIVSRARRRPTDSQVARFIEERVGAETSPPELPDALVSAVQVMDSGAAGASPFADAVIGRAVSLLHDIPPARVIPSRSLRRAALQAAAGTAAAALALAAAGPAMQQAAATGWGALFPQSLRVVVRPGDVRIPGGRPLRIEAAVLGRVAQMLDVVPVLLVSAGGEERALPMGRAGAGFAFAFESVDRSFTYRVAAGTSVSDPYSVTAVTAPRVGRIDIRYEYPAFTGLPPREETNGGDILAPAGTRVGLRVHVDGPATAGELAFSDGSRLPLAPGDEAELGAELVIEREGGYRVALENADGMRGRGEVEYFIRVMDDRPPDVRIVRPSADQGITPLEEVVIEARADDDYRIGAFELVYTVAGREPRIVPFSRVNGTDRVKAGSHTLAAETLAVMPGDVITYYAQARDVSRGRRAALARSDMFFLEVKPFSEEFVSAQSQGMGGGAGGTQIDALIAAQKEIISATWNLERRSAAGRSDADLASVTQAQTELRALTEGMLGAGGWGGQARPPAQQITPPRAPVRRRTAPEPLDLAITAMDLAVEQLSGGRASGALPHEMAALQRLLQTQAAVRRRQVMQQAAAGGGGGSSRSDHDLSVLFDRELQRQQRTSYETPPASSDPGAARDQSELLDRVRELARRQEELSREGRELTRSGAPAGEHARRLERLAREQQELHERARRLGREMQQDGEEGQQGGEQEGDGRRGGKAASNAGGGGAEAMRDAAAAMSRAADELRRQNPSGAARSGQDAADALRQIEHGRGDAADAPGRAAGELQLEVQQIAEAQRRMATEAARLERELQAPGSPAAEALRRLAAEKDGLAARVEELERTARSRERSTRGADAARFRDAARALEEHQIGPRMRSSAQAMRQAAEGGQPGEGVMHGMQARGGTEEQLSRALESVIDALGGKGGSAERQATGALDRARDIRERLDDLERQVRMAERDAHSGAEGGERLARARDAYARELERSRDALARMSRAQPSGRGGSTPEHHEFSRSSPGNEAFKRDFSAWESLRSDVDHALERYESAVAAGVRKSGNMDRLSTGGSEGVPDAYRPLVSRYFEAIAGVKK